MKRLQPTQMVRFSVEHPWIVILFAVLITALSVIPITHLQMEPDVESLLPGEIEEKEATETPEYSADYDRMAILVKGDELFTVAGLQQFSLLIESLGNEMGADKIIDPFSMITIEKAGSRLRPLTMAKGGKSPGSPEDLADFIKRLDADPFSRGLISSQDGKALAAYFLIPKGRPYLEQNTVVQKIIADAETDGLKIIVTGSIPFSAETERYLTRDAFRLMALVIVTILLSYYLGFRSRRAMILPVVLVIMGTAWSLGFMGLMGWRLSMVSIVSPPLVLTLGSSYSIHILSEYYRFPMTRENKQAHIIQAVTGVSGTIVMASITTITGLLSLLLASMIQTRQFAVSTTVGIVATALLSLSVFPAFLSLQPPVTDAKVNKVNTDILSRSLEGLGPFLVRQRRAALILLISIIAVFIFLIPRVEYNTSPISYFPEDSPVISELMDFSREVGGMDELTITLTAPENSPNFFLKAEILKQIHQMELEISSLPDVSHLISLPAYLSFASKTALNREGDFTNTGLNILVSRMFLSAGTSEIPPLANNDFSTIGITIRVFNRNAGRPIDEKDTARIAEELERILLDDLPEGVTWNLDGLSLKFLELSGLMRRDFLVSTVAALLFIGFICTIAFRSLKKGILTLIPMVAGITATFILMALFHIPLDMTTIMMSCVAIGVGVDDAIHFLLRYRQEELKNPGNPQATAAATLRHTGRPIILTTLSIVLGLSWFAFADFQPIRYFGLLIVFTLATAGLSTLLILPPLAGKKETS